MTAAPQINSVSSQWIAFGVICLGTFFSTVTVSAVNVAVPELALELSASAVQISWLPAAFILTNVICVLPFGRLADSQGRKRIYLWGLTLFSASSLIAGLVKNIEQLLIMRAVQGVGGAMIFATGMALIVSIVPQGRRGTALGIASAFMYFGLGCGPIIGGWLTEYYGWRSVFLFQVPFTLVAVALILWKVKGEWANGLKEPIDWQGSLIFMLWVAAVFTGVSEMPTVRGFTLFLVGLAILAYFVHHQLHRKYPLIRFQPVLDNKIFSKSLASSLLMYSASYPLMFLLTLYLQYNRGFTPVETGKFIVIPALVTALVAPVAGKLSDKYSSRMVACVGCLIAFTGFFLLFSVIFQTTLLFTIAGLILFGVGFGFFTTPNNNAAMSSVLVERLGIASALMNLSRTFGNMLGTMTVMLLISWNIGSETITPENYPALTNIMYLGLTLSCGYTLLAARFSYMAEQPSR